MPIVVVSDQHDPASERRTIQRGVQDVVVKKHWTAEELARPVHHAVDRKRAEQNLAYIAQYDPLTPLANRALFHDRLTHPPAQGRTQEAGSWNRVAGSRSIPRDKKTTRG